MENYPSDIFIEQYKAAAAEGAVIELKLRLLADKVPGLQKWARAKKLEDIEVEVVRYFDGALSEEDKKTLRFCRQLRNKILHCDFNEVRHKLKQSGRSTRSVGVRKCDVSGLSGNELVAKIHGFIAGVKGTFEYVSDASKNSGHIFGWLLEMGAGGDFRLATGVFKEATAIVNQLIGMDNINGQPVEKP